MVKRRVGEISPEWLAVEFVGAAVHPGVLVGLCVTPTMRWAAPLAKFAGRSRTLGGLGLGWYTIIHIFNMMVASVSSYVGQLAKVPQLVHSTLTLSISRLSRLPHSTIPSGSSRTSSSLGLQMAMSDLVRTFLMLPLTCEELQVAIRDAAIIDEEAPIARLASLPFPG